MHCECEMMQKNGKKLLIEFECTIGHDPTEETQQLYCILQDITEQKRLEAALKQEQDRAKIYLESTGAMFVALNKQGIVTNVNNKACEIIGVTRSQIVGKNWLVHFIPEEWKERVQEIANSLLTGENGRNTFENPIISADGGKRYIVWTNVVLYGEDGQLTGFLSSGIDITDKKQAEEHLTYQMEK